MVVLPRGGNAQLEADLVVSLHYCLCSRRTKIVPDAI